MSSGNIWGVQGSLSAVLAGREGLFFVGIGGIQMHALALLARERGYRVGGSDIVESETVRALRQAGIPVQVGHRAENVRGYGAVVYSLAVPPDAPELVAAREAGALLLSRAALLGCLMAEYPTSIAVAGTHGKSTTTAMLAAGLARQGAGATVLSGAPLGRGAPVWRQGGKETFLCEACEYGDSFLCLHPHLALALNMEWEHTDYFKTPAQLSASFLTFLSRAPRAVIGQDSPSLAALLPAVQAAGTEVWTCGLGDGAQGRATQIEEVQGETEFLYTLRGRAWGRIHLRVPGMHNVQNALAAITAQMALYGAEEAVFAAAQAALSAFAGVPCRLEYRGRWQGARVYGDYAHHPTEIGAAARTLRPLLPGGGRLLCLFQPHTFSRTHDLFSGLVQALSAFDRVFFADIYAAREQDTCGIGSCDLAGALPQGVYGGTPAMTWQMLCAALRPGDIAVIMGAGDVQQLFSCIALEA